MNKILVDTNVIIDLLASRKPFNRASERIFSLADLGEIELVASALSLVNCFYVLNDVMKIKSPRSILRKFKVLVKTKELNQKIIELALNDKNFKDFEDGIQYYTAIESNCSLILTRNGKDFKKSTLPVLNPKEFLAKVDLDK